MHLASISVNVSAGTDLVVLEGLPLLGTTYILAPAAIIYHPLALLAVGIGLLAGLFWRRSVAAGFLFATTAAPLAAVFLPGIAPLFASFATLATARRILIAVPIAASLGIGLDALLAGLPVRLPARLDRQARDGLLSVLLIGAIGLLYLEPWPLIPASGRDQIRAANEIETLRAMQPSDAALVARLADLVPADRDSRVVMNARASNYVIESVPHTLITGGRFSGNLTYPATARFLTEAVAVCPLAGRRGPDLPARVRRDAPRVAGRRHAPGPTPARSGTLPAAGRRGWLSDLRRG